MKIVFRLITIVCVINLMTCSSDSIEEEMITHCIVVKVLDTDLPITNTRITFYGHFNCCCGGCGFEQIGVGTTNEAGEVCVSLSRLDFLDVDQISCISNGTYYEGLFEFSSNLTVVYVDTLF